MTTITAKNMVSVTTHKWLLVVPAEGKVRSCTEVSRLAFDLINEALGAGHISGISQTNVSSVFLLQATNEAIGKLQLQSWVKSVMPHASQLKPYEIEISADIEDAKLRSLVSKLKNRILEMMLEKDILNPRRHGRVLYVVSTVRGIEFLSSLAPLGRPRSIG